MVRAFGQGHPNLKRLRLSSSDAGEATLSDDGRGTYAEVDGIRKRVGRGFAAAVGLTRPFGLRIIEFQYVSSQARRSRVAWGAADGVGADTAVRRSVGRHGTAFPTQNAVPNSDARIYYMRHSTAARRPAAGTSPPRPVHFYRFFCVQL